jgi:hypothetical protein
MGNGSDAAPAAVPTTRPAWRVWLGRFAPYLIALGVIAFILNRYSIEAIRDEMARGNSLPLIPIAFITYVLSLLWVTGSDKLVFAGAIGENAPSYFSVARGKAACVLLHIVHYALGQGAYATWIGRRTGIGLARTSGLIGYIVLAELCSVSLFAVVVIAIGRPAVPSALVLTAGGIALALVLLILVAPITHLERVAALETWSRVGRSRGLGQIGMRLLQHTTTTTGTWLAAQAFGLDIPFAVMLSYIPVILIVGSLPVNIAGFGAVQGAWLLLSPWAPAERILAFSVVWQASSALALVLRGLPFLRPVLAEIRAGAPRP